MTTMPAPNISDSAQRGKIILAVQWGLFIAWLIAVILLHIGYGAALFWLGVIILIAQFARRCCELKMNRIWNILAALLIVVGGAVLLAAKIEIFWSALIFVGFSLMIIAVGATLLCVTVRAAIDFTHKIRHNGAAL